MADSVETALRTGDGVLQVVEHIKGSSPAEHVFSERYACRSCGTNLSELEPRQFSFNSPYGACQECGGLGTSKHVNPDLLLADGSISLLEGVVLPWGAPTGHLRNSVIAGLAAAYEFDAQSPWNQLPEEARHAIMHGSGRMKIRFPYRAGSGKTRGNYEDTWDGVIENVERRYQETKSDTVRTQLHEYMSTLTCTTCEGSRLRAESLAVTIAGRSLGSVVDLSIGEALEFHGSMAERVVVTGAQCFDRWFDRTPSRSREEFCQRVGVSAERPFVVFTGSTASISAPAPEVRFVKRWIEAVRSGPGSLKDLGILIRPHPYNCAHWASVELSNYPNVAVYPRGGANPVDNDDRADYYDTLHYGAGIVGINTSAMIEAGIQDRPVFTIVDSSFDDTQTGTLHFRYLLPENGGHLRQLTQRLPSTGSESSKLGVCGQRAR